MMDIRYFALDDLDVEDSGYEARPIEVEAETLQYDTDEEDFLEADDPAVLPPAPPEVTVAAILPSTIQDHKSAVAPPPKKPVTKATGETKSAPRKVAKKKPVAKKAPARKATSKGAKKAAVKPAKKTAGKTKKKIAKKTAAKAAKPGKKAR